MYWLTMKKRHLKRIQFETQCDKYRKQTHCYSNPKLSEATISFQGVGIYILSLALIVAVLTVK